MEEVQESAISLRYTTHFNWDWIVKLCVSDAVQQWFIQWKGLNNKCEWMVENSKFQNLRSVIKSLSDTNVRVKPLFSLFRIEITYKEDIYSVWADFQSFSFLDPKDSLQRHLKAVNCDNLMPQTVLIPWDVPNEQDLISIIQSQYPESLNIEGNIPFGKCILKAALGAGGFGLYFVENTLDVIEVIQSHASRAKSFDGFLEELKSSHNGKVPDWSLQRLVLPVTSISRSCKTQIRAYAVKLKSRIYLATQFEVRLPVWNECSDTEITKLQDSVEHELIGKGCARPYNRMRNKGEKNRVLLEEIEELDGSYESIYAISKRVLSSLYPSIELNDQQSPKCNEYQNNIAIVGIDLIVEKSDATQVEDEFSINGFRAYVLEFNSNPAIAGQDKRMSRKYREHLQKLVLSFAKLGLSSGSDLSDGFLVDITPK